MPARNGALKGERFRKPATGFPAGRGHFCDGGVRDGRDPGPGENGLDLLGLAQGVGEESGDNTFFQGTAPKTGVQEDMPDFFSKEARSGSEVSPKLLAFGGVAALGVVALLGFVALS